jgi:hypothetical protein
MKAWSAFYPDLLTEIPSAPLPIVDQWLLNTAIEFCERSKAWVVDLALLDAVANQMSYALGLPADTELVEIITVWFSGQKITPESPRFLEQTFDDWLVETGKPQYYTQQNSGAIMLVPAPADATVGAIKIKAAVKPGPAATGIEDWIYSQWRQGLAAGAKAKLFAMNEVPWASPDHVAINLSLFEATIDQATDKAASGLVRSRPRFSGKFC